ncbi:MAG: hemerythrin domain-containing protein [Rhodospirillales bacterium]|nr:hemerythrin domain-containing protein [Rhodospirillales bacterium]
MTGFRRLEWRDSFSVGIAAIDDDHRRMIGVLNEITASLVKKDYVLCEELFDRFITLAADHFLREERYLYAANYPKAAEHASHHGRLLVMAGQVRERCRNLIKADQMSECFNDMVSFLVDDILGADIQFKSYLDEHRVDRLSLEPKI